MCKKAFTLSYDDGINQDRRLIEIFRKYGIKATFNLNTGIQTPESRWTDNNIEISRMEQDGLTELYDGFEIASHGLTHAALTSLDDKGLITEMKTDMDNIERIYGTRPVGMAYAYGVYDDKTVDNLKKLGLKYGRGVEATHSFELQTDMLRFKSTCHHNDEMLFELAEKFIALPEDTPALFYVWGHSYEFDVNNNWEIIEELCRLMSGRRDIYYGTNTEVFTYLGMI